MAFFFVYGPVKIKNNSGEWLDVPPILLAIAGNMKADDYAFGNQDFFIEWPNVFETFEKAREYAITQGNSLYAHPIFEVEGDFQNLPVDRKEDGEIVRYLSNSNDIRLLSASLAHAYPEDSEHAKHAEKIDLHKVKLTPSKIGKIHKADQDKIHEKGEQLTQDEINACLFERDVSRKYNPIWKKDNFTGQLMNASLVVLGIRLLLPYLISLAKNNSFPRHVSHFLFVGSRLGFTILSAYRLLFGSLQAPTINLIEEEEKFEKLVDDLREKYKSSEETFKMTSYLKEVVMERNSDFLPLAIRKLERAKRNGEGYINKCCQKIEEGTFVQLVEELPRASSSSSCCS